MEEIEKFKSWTDVPTNYKSKSWCNKERLITKDVEPVAAVYQKLSHKWIELYNIDTLESKPALTPKQVIGLNEGRKKREQKYTCKVCGVFSYSIDLQNTLCPSCYNMLLNRLYEETETIKALEKRLSWTSSANKDNYLILDTETTGLDDDDEIVDIAIIDMNGNVLLNTLIKPSKQISEEAAAVNHIKDSELINAPTITDVINDIDRIVSGKTILSYNADFDSRVLNQSLAKHNLKRSYSWDCVMFNQMEILNSDRYISLQNSIGYKQGHRALSDCKAVLHLISDCEWIEHRLDRAKKNIAEIKEELGKYKEHQEMKADILRNEASAICHAERKGMEQSKVDNAKALLDLLDDETISKRIELDVDVVRELRKTLSN